MSHQHFIDALEDELRRLRAHFKRIDVQKFVADHWPAIERDPDVSKWAREFLDAGHGSVTV